MLNIAIISTWHVHAREYTELFNNNEETCVKAVWDEDAEKGQAFAKEFNADFEKDLDTLLNRSDIDAVCINAATNSHKDIMIKAANCKKHIFTEKALTLTTADALEVKEAIAKNNVKFTISFPHRTFVYNLFAKKVVEENLLGQITYMRSRNAHSGSSRDWLPAHFYDKEKCGGGAMVDLGAHPLYLTRWLLGKPANVFSTFTNVTGKPVEDNAVSVFTYENGTIAVVETGFVTESSPTTLEIHGTEGSIMITGSEIKYKSTKLNLGDKNGWITPTELPKTGKSAVNQFIDGIIRNEKIIFDIDEAIGLTEMAEAAYKSYNACGKASL